MNGRIQRQLQRLLTPVDDALQAAGSSHLARVAVSSILVKEMATRRTAFWGWNERDWAETICSSVKAFSRRQKRGRGYRHDLIAAAYLLGQVRDIRYMGVRSKQKLATRIFGPQRLRNAASTVADRILSWGGGPRHVHRLCPRLTAELMLFHGSPRLVDFTPDVLEKARQGKMAIRLKCLLGVFGKALATLQGRESTTVTPKRTVKTVELCVASGVPEEWARWCIRWYENSTASASQRRHVFYDALIIGRWLAAKHPDFVNPSAWTRDTAAECVAQVNRLTVGEYCNPRRSRRRMVGKPLRPSSKSEILTSLRTFFCGLQEKEWIKRRFDPFRALATPASVRRLVVTNPRIMADDVWAKLLHAGLNLTMADLPMAENGQSPRMRIPWYPLEMVRAVAAVWLFAGLRQDEIRRLSVGCIRWQRDELTVLSTGETLPPHSVCMLTVPTNKTSPAYTKPVDPILGRAVEAWEKVRPSQPPALDPKTSEMVHYLFSYRSQRIGECYLNETIIPLLCRKAGVPQRDARGRITSHRARSTLATQLYNAKDGMSLFELMQWLGHRSPSATQHYVKITPTKLAKAYADADYFKRNVRTIEVLIDRDAVLSGAAAHGKPWQYYDLGHGYCTYDFFDQCPHRMACAKCSFYLPKEATAALMEEGKVNLHRMRKEVSLTDDERSAVDDGIQALSNLTERMAAVPAPDGHTRDQLVQLTNPSEA
jgi:integrase